MKKLVPLLVIAAVLAPIFGMQARAAAAPPTTPGGQYWGVDSVTAGPSLLGGVQAAYAATPGFWGQYISDCYAFSCISETAAQEDLADGIDILPIVADPEGSSDSGGADGTEDGDTAVAAAEALRIPKGLVIFRDFEEASSVNAAFIVAWYNAVSAGGYSPGFYLNALRGDGGSAYCQAVADQSSVGSSYLWASEHEPDAASSTPPGSAPPFFGGSLPAAFPDCAGQDDFWQYNENDAGGVDEDEAQTLAPLWSALVPVAPSAPSITSVTPGNESAALSWSPPSSDGGAVITSYAATAQPGGASCSTGGTSCTIGGLTNGQPYSVSVTATNSAGTSPPSSSIAVTPYTVSGPPELIGVTPGNGTLLASWQAPAGDGGSPITSYTATASNGSSCVTTATSCTISGLGNGTTYSVTVVASNAAGNSGSSNSISGTPEPTVPSAPGTPDLVPGNASLSVSWTASGTDGGDPITSYIVAASPGTSTCETTGALSCVLDDLTNGTTYSVTVEAGNAVGVSAQSGSASAFPYTKASVPRQLKVASGNEMLKVSWKAPTSDGGSPITSYTANVYDPSGSLFSCQTSRTNCVVTGLTNGTTYLVSVIATNQAGNSPATRTVKGIPNATPPTAPKSVTAIGASGVITVSWQPPASDGGDPITSYTAAVTASEGGASCTADSLTCKISGLTSGKTYQVSVTATSAAGTSPPSKAISVKVKTVPGAPTAVVLTSENGSLGVSWTAPTRNGGSPITGYTATASPGDEFCTTTVTSCTITGLTNGTSYSVTVVATNAVGNSKPSAPSPGAPTTQAPSSPQSVTLTPSDSALEVSWSAPATDGGSLITGYTATAAPGNEACTTAVTSCTITGLTNGTNYSVTVVATNAVGPSTPSTPVVGAPSGIPGAPLNVTASPGSTEAVVSWTPPPNDGGLAISSYVATAVSGGATCTYAVSSPEIDTCTVTGLTNGSSYYFTVVAYNAAGPGSPSAPSNTVIPVSVPDAPGNVGASSVTQSSATISWSAPFDEGSPITGYTVSGGSGCSTSGTSCSIGGLSASTTYTACVTATNAVGTGSPACTSFTTPPPLTYSEATGYGPVQTWSDPNGPSGSKGPDLAANTVYQVDCVTTGTSEDGDAYWYLISGTSDYGSADAFCDEGATLCPNGFGGTPPVDPNVPNC